MEMLLFFCFVSVCVCVCVCVCMYPKLCGNKKNGCFFFASTVQQTTVAIFDFFFRLYTACLKNKKKKIKQIVK